VDPPSILGARSVREVRGLEHASSSALTYEAAEVKSGGHAAVEVDG